MYNSEMGTYMTKNKKLSYQEPLLKLLRNFGAETNYQKALQSIISLASELTKSEVASILKYEEADEHLHFLALSHTQYDAMQSLRVPVDTSIAGWVYQNAKTLVIQDVREDERFYSEIDQILKFQTRSILVVPLLVKGKSVGVLEAINKTSRANYNGEDVIILETLASQVALIIENIKLEQHAAQMQAATDRLEQMKEKFIAITSHELRTPLGIILGHSTFLREISDKKHHEQLDKIIHSVDRLKNIIANLSNMKNFESGAARIRMERIPLSDLLHKITNSFHKTAQEKKIKLSVNTTAPNIFVNGDKEKISIAVGNLIKNALTFTPEGGHVSIILEQTRKDVKITVTDDGIGISDKDIKHIFRRFYQVESHLTRQHGGMGLGLSVAKVMVELHGGKIWAKSTPNKGSQFSFTIPLDHDQIKAS